MAPPQTAWQARGMEAGMRGTEFEFRHRFWFIVLIFLVAFGVYAFEPMNAVEWLLRLPENSGTGAFPAAEEARLIFALGAALVGVAAWMRTWGTAYLNTEVVRDRKAHGERLVADGPYRYVRNPLYFGNMLLALGLCFMASPIGAVVLVAGMAVFVLRLVGYEEVLLVEKQGHVYQKFLERVPRLWPALRPRLPAGGAQPRWGQAWLGEGWMWAIFLGAVVFAVTLNPKLFEYIVWGAFIVLYLPLRILIKRRAKVSPNEG
jgi:protein-S-isoprenylcysteine O-methyltransferase Ste14